LFFDGDIDRFLGVVAARFPPEFRADLDLSHVPDVNGDIVAGGDHRLPDVIDGFDPPHALDQHLLGSFADDASAEIPVGVLDGLLDLVDGDVVVLEHLRLEKDLELLDETSEVDDERDAGNALEPVTDRPVGHRSQIHRVYTISADGELEDFSHPRRNRPQDRLGGADGQPAGNELELARDDLSGLVDIRPPVELDRHDRIPGRGFRPDPGHPGSPREQALQGKRDQPLHVLRSHPGIFGDDLDQRRIEVGIDIFGHLGVDDNAPDRDKADEEDRQETMLQGEIDNLVNHVVFSTKRIVPSPASMNPGLLQNLVIKLGLQLEVPFNDDLLALFQARLDLHIAILFDARPDQTGEELIPLLDEDKFVVLVIENCLLRDGQSVRLMVEKDPDVREHAGLEFVARILDLGPDGDRSCLLLQDVADIANFPLKLLVGIGRDGNVDILAGPHLGDIPLVDLRVYAEKAGIHDRQDLGGLIHHPSQNGVILDDLPVDGGK
jgi:hypothetical protein